MKLTDSVTSTDILTAATPNSVKQVNDNANAAMASASSVNDNLTSHKIDYKTLIKLLLHKLVHIVKQKQITYSSINQMLKTVYW